MTSRPNRILAIVVGLVAVVAVVAGVLAATRHASEYPRGTPAGAVQAYLSAVIDGDHQKAAGFLAPGSSCAVADLDRAPVPDEVRVVLRDTHVDGATAQVDVDVVLPSGGPFGGADYSERQTFRLARAGQGWLITGIPWPMFECSKEM
ncbi:MAG: hypothetical protein ACXVWU_07955 [Nocardioides sp.]